MIIVTHEAQLKFLSLHVLIIFVFLFLSAPIIPTTMQANAKTDVQFAIKSTNEYSLLVAKVYPIPKPK
ncbi:MAG: hypothetical protein K2L48_02765 [Mycoplasmoidaceae bacterium]|nr:hypothetical protein [Mycoplasmoidaceae bacterium]